jgi:hypothetical protein
MSTIAAVTLALALASSQTAAPRDSIWLWVDTVVNAEEKERKEILRDLEARVRADLATDESSVDLRYALAVVLAARANTEGGQAKVRAASELYEQVVVILHAEPGHVGARHLLGRLHAAVRRMGGMTRWIATNLLGGGTLKAATWESAEVNLAYAEAQAPEVPDHHLQLALLYRDTGRPELAEAELQHVMALEASSARDVAAREEAGRVWAALQEQD